MYICKKKRIIAPGKLNIEEIKTQFKDVNVLETGDITRFYEQAEREIKPATVNWRIFTLVQMGVLQRVGRGKFTLGEGKSYRPEVSLGSKSIYKKLTAAFPYLKIVMWHTSVLNEFMHHQPGKFYHLVEVEKEAVEAVFYFLKGLKKTVFIDSDKGLFEKYLPEKGEVFLVKTLVTEAPVLNVDGLNTISIEKMLVDLFCDKSVFETQQGREMLFIFREALGKYTINMSKMLRYAGRRRRKEDFEKFVNSTTI